MEKSLQQHCVVLDSCGPVSVYVQGEEKHLKTGVVFLTVHDVGSSYKNWLEFTSHPSMADVCKRAVFLHVCLPGQEPGAPDLPENYVFPKMRELCCTGYYTGPTQSTQGCGTGRRGRSQPDH